MSERRDCLPLDRPPRVGALEGPFHGSYEGLPSAWVDFDAWIRAGGFTPGPDLWERYLINPDSDPDPATWRTELSRPLIG